MHHTSVSDTPHLSLVHARDFPLTTVYGTVWQGVSFRAQNATLIPFTQLEMAVVLAAFGMGKVSLMEESIGDLTEVGG